MNVKSMALITLLATSTSAAFAADNTGTTSMNVQQQMKTSLQQSGFSDVKVLPDSFLIQAKDKAGNPVTMFVTPDSMTEYVTENNNGSAGPNNGMFRAIPAKDEISSKVIGLEVYNNDNKSIGQIKDIALSPGGRVNGYILSVGGFLGIGDHYVAVRPSAVNLTWDATAKKWHAAMNATADQLKSAPEYKYAS